MEGKNKSLLVLFMMNFIGCSGYAMIIPLFPPLAADRGVSDSIVGYIFALSPVGAVIISLILGTNMKIEQMKKIMFLGILFSIIGMIGFALIIYVQNKTWFIVISFASRLVTGFGSTLCFTPAFSLAAYLFPDRLSQIMSLMEIISGVSIFCGPFIGSLFYIIGDHTPIGGYALPFYVMALLYTAIIPFLIFYLDISRKNDVIEQGTQQNRFSVKLHVTSEVRNSGMDYNNRISLPERASTDQRRSLLQDMIMKVTYKRVFASYGIQITYISFIFLFVSSFGIRTYMAVYIQDEFNLSESNSTLFFLIKPVVYGLSAFLVGHTPTIDTKVTFLVGLGCSSISCFLYGPDSLFTGLPKQLWIVGLADALNSVGVGFLCALIVPELASILKELYPKQELECNDMASALYVSGWSIGEFIGPVAGGLIIEQVQFARSSTILGLPLLISFFFYAFYVYQYKRRTRKLDLVEDLIK